MKAQRSSVLAANNPIQSAVKAWTAWRSYRHHDLLLRVLTALLFAAIYAWVLLPISRFYWFIPAGWRFAALALLPWPYWPWIIGGEFLARVVASVIPWHSPDLLAALMFRATDLATWLLIFAAPLAALPGSILLRLRNKAAPVSTSLATPNGMGWWLVACLVAAIGETAANLLYIHVDGHIALGMGPIHFALGKLTGDYIGVIALAPALLATIVTARERIDDLVWQSDVLPPLAFAAAYLAVMRTPVDPALYDYARILVLVPAFLAAFRHGWRGAAIVLCACSLLVTLVSPLHAVDPYRNLFTQMLLALSGTAALLLGAALDSQRASSATLAARNTDLEHANRDLDLLGADLRDAAQRNLRIEEEQRRRLAAEIHDELGQNLTAVHTRLKLAADRLDAAQLSDVSSSIFDILGTMRRSVHGLMDSLRPPALDEFGLLRALDDGPLRDLAERSSLQYAFRIAGEPALIDALREDTQIAIWRIAQEATTNAVRHARATRFDVRLRIGIRGDAVWAVLDLRDNGIGLDATRVPAHRGEGLQGLRDRVLALEGVSNVSSTQAGMRIHVLLRQTL